MAIRRESGRRYSKVVVETFGVDEFAQAFAKLGTVKPFQERVDDVVAGARAFLAERGIPGCAQLYQSRLGGEYQCAKPDARDSGGFCPLDIFVIKHLDLERDCFEHLAARVIVSADAMQRREGEHTLEAAFELGTLKILSWAYAKKTRQTKGAGGKDKRQAWADALREEITSWKDIPEDPEEPLVIWTGEGEYRIYRGGGYVHCIHNHKSGTTEKKLQKRSFIRGYLNKSR